MDGRIRQGGQYAFYGATGGRDQPPSEERTGSRFFIDSQPTSEPPLQDTETASLTRMLEQFANSPGATILNLTTIAITVGAFLSFLPGTADVGHHVELVSALICGIYGAAASLVALNIFRPFRSHVADIIATVTTALAAGASNTLFAFDGTARLADVIGGLGVSRNASIFSLLMTVSLCFGAGMAYFSTRIELGRSPLRGFFENLAVSFTTGGLLSSLGRTVHFSRQIASVDFSPAYATSVPVSSSFERTYETCVLAIQWFAFVVCAWADSPVATSLASRVVSPVNSGIAQMNLLLSSILSTAGGRLASILLSCINLILHGLSFGAPHDHPSMFILLRPAPAAQGHSPGAEPL